AALGDERGKVTRRNRAVELAAFRSLPQHREALSVQLLGDLLGLALGREIARFQFDFHRFEPRPVLLGGAQRLSPRQEKIGCKSILDADHVSYLAEFTPPFEKDSFHLWFSMKSLLSGC